MSHINFIGMGYGVYSCLVIIQIIYCMKKNEVKLFVVCFLICFFVLGASDIWAQTAPGGTGGKGLGQITTQIKGYKEDVKNIINAILGLSALGGGLYTYFKVQNDDGGSGKKAIGNYVLALIFGGCIWVIVEAFFGS